MMSVSRQQLKILAGSGSIFTVASGVTLLDANSINPLTSVTEWWRLDDEDEDVKPVTLEPRSSHGSGSPRFSTGTRTQLTTSSGGGNYFYSGESARNLTFSPSTGGRGDRLGGMSSGRPGDQTFLPVRIPPSFYKGFLLQDDFRFKRKPNDSKPYAHYIEWIKEYERGQNCRIFFSDEVDSTKRPIDDPYIPTEKLVLFIRIFGSAEGKQLCNSSYNNVLFSQVSSSTKNWKITKWWS